MPASGKRTRFTDLTLETQLVLWKRHLRMLWMPIWFAQHAGSKRAFERLLRPIKEKLEPSDVDSREYWIFVSEVWQAFMANRNDFAAMLNEGPGSTITTAMHFGMQKGVFNGQGDSSIEPYTYECILKNFGMSLADHRTMIKSAKELIIRISGIDFKLAMSGPNLSRFADAYCIERRACLIPFPGDRIFRLRSALKLIKLIEEINKPIDYNAGGLKVRGFFILHRIKSRPAIFWPSTITESDIYPVIELYMEASQAFEQGEKVPVDPKYLGHDWTVSAIQQALGVEVKV